MRVLVACEFSGIVRDAFIRRGHHAISCDLLPTEREGPHVQGDILNVLYQDWDLIIAHPPCQFLANSGVRWLYTKEGRWDNMVLGAKFFMLFLDHPCKKICIENPVMHKHALKLINWHRHDQTVQPYQFGHLETKRTCLWLKGLPPLIPTKDVKEETMALKYSERALVHYHGPGPERQKNRSRFYTGIADAMAEQWGSE